MSERRVLDLESEVNQRTGFNPHWGKKKMTEFHVVKPLMPILVLLPMLCVCEKLDCNHCNGAMVGRLLNAHDN